MNTYTRNEAVEWIVLEDEAVLFDGTELHHLDASGTAVWLAVDGFSSADEIASALAAQFDSDAAQVRMDTVDLLRTLAQKRLVDVVSA